VTEAARAIGPIRELGLTHPANWGSGRRSVLVEAARQVGITNVELVGEPLAAATYYAHTRGGDLPVGACVLVYDLGAGTCDVTLMRREPHGFSPVASDGLNDVGGLDVDAAVVAFLQASLGQLWTSAATRRQLWDDVRSAKEMLSRASGTVVMIPALGREVPLGREQLEGLARPVLRSTVAMTRAMLVESGVGPGAIAGLFLVGGSSRIPLVATMLHEALGIPPVVAEQPELVVAEGSLYTGPNRIAPASGAARVALAPPMPAGPPSPAVSRPGSPAPALSAYPAPVGPATKARRSPALTVAAAVVAALVLLGGGGAAYALYNDKVRGGGAGDGGPSGSPPTLAGQQPVGAGVAGEYDLRKLPGELCDLVDIGPLASRYKTETSEPVATRNLTTTVGFDICTITRSRTDGTTVIGVSLSFTAYVYQDVSLAKTYQKTALDNAKLNTPVTEVTDLGEEAFAHEGNQSSGAQKTTLSLTITTRDSNLQWSSVLTAVRSDNAGWTGAEKRDLQSKLAAVTRSNLTKITPLVAR